MSIYAAEKLIYKLKKDKALQGKLVGDPQSVLVEYDLSDEERAAMSKGDIVSLYKLGIHPLLLAPYARIFKISRHDYVKTLAPLSGLRKMSS